MWCDVGDAEAGCRFQCLQVNGSGACQAGPGRGQAERSEEDWLHQCWAVSPHMYITDVICHRPACLLIARVLLSRSSMPERDVGIGSMSVCLSHAGIDSKQCFHCPVAQGPCFLIITFIGQAITTYWTFHDHALHFFSGVFPTLPLMSGIQSVIQSLTIWTSLHQSLKPDWKHSSTEGPISINNHSATLTAPAIRLIGRHTACFKIVYLLLTYRKSSPLLWTRPKYRSCGWTLNSCLPGSIWPLWPSCHPVYGTRRRPTLSVFRVCKVP